MTFFIKLYEMNLFFLKKNLQKTINTYSQNISIKIKFEKNKLLLNKTLWQYYTH